MSTNNNTVYTCPKCSKYITGKQPKNIEEDFILKMMIDEHNKLHLPNNL